MALFSTAIVIAAGLSYYFLTEFESYNTKKLEEGLSSQATALAAVLSAELRSSDSTGPVELTDVQASQLSLELSKSGSALASRIRILDGKGEAVADSEGLNGLGVHYAETTEVASALRGEAHTAVRTTEDGRISVLVAQPVLVNDEVMGVVYTSGTTFSVRTLVREYRTQLLIGALVLAAGIFALSSVFARHISAPLRDLAATAVAFASGDHSVRARPRGSEEIGALADGFNAMADEVQTVLSELNEEERRKSRFVSDVSHELRTPLTAIRGAAETLLEGDVPEDDARQFLSTIVHESERLARLAEDLLTLQRIEGATGELPISRVDLAETAQRAIESLAPLTEARGVRVLLEGEAPPVLGDRDRLQQVFGNLIDNASRMTPEGKTVTIRLSAEGGQAVARVLDEGPGISDEALPHIFDRFYRSQASRDRSTGGAGLGLAIVAAIVKAHTGTIVAERREEGGTVFTMRIPALTE